MLTIELLPLEKDLLATIKLEALPLDGADDVRRNGEAVCALMRALIARKGIPAQRAEYFCNPSYHIGRMKGSYRELFIRNGNVGEEIYRHPHFLRFLSYFIYGAKLPEPVIKAFSDEVTKCEPVTSGDVVPLGKFARAQARLYRLSPHSAAEEYYKLALDCGLSQMYASAIRQSVKKAR